MKLIRKISRYSFGLLTLFSFPFAAFSVKAETVVVNRGPNNAAHIVQSDRIPFDAKQRVETPPHTFPNLVTRGPGGAKHINPNKSIIPNDTIVAYPEVGNTTAIGGGSTSKP